MILYKGFTRAHLEDFFGVRFVNQGVVVPYYGVSGDLYREKLFSAEGHPLRWLGEGRRPQVPYGLETLSKGGTTAFLTEGESCAWTLRATFSHNPVLAVPGASSWQAEWRPLLERFPVLYLSFDADEAGRKLLDSVWPELPCARWVRLPEGLDTRDLIQLHGGVEEYERLLDDADYGAALREMFTARAKREEAARVAA